MAALTAALGAAVVGMATIAHDALPYSIEPKRVALFGFWLLIATTLSGSAAIILKCVEVFGGKERTGPTLIQRIRQLRIRSPFYFRDSADAAPANARIAGHAASEQIAPPPPTPLDGTPISWEERQQIQVIRAFWKNEGEYATDKADSLMALIFTPERPPEFFWADLLQGHRTKLREARESLRETLQSDSDGSRVRFSEVLDKLNVLLDAYFSVAIWLARISHHGFPFDRESYREYLARWRESNIRFRRVLERELAVRPELEGKLKAFIRWQEHFVHEFLGSGAVHDVGVDPQDAARTVGAPAVPVDPNTPQIIKVERARANERPDEFDLFVHIFIKDDTAFGDAWRLDAYSPGGGVRVNGHPGRIAEHSFPQPGRYKLTVTFPFSPGIPNSAALDAMFFEQIRTEDMRGREVKYSPPTTGFFP